MDEFEGSIIFVIGVGVGLIIAAILIGSFGIQTNATAEFICESHGLELINYEVKSPSFSKVECGNKKPELQYENYKVFTK